jgi:hypothetical protein
MLTISDNKLCEHLYINNMKIYRDYEVNCEILFENLHCMFELR